MERKNEFSKSDGVTSDIRLDVEQLMNKMNKLVQWWWNKLTQRGFISCTSLQPSSLLKALVSRRAVCCNTIDAASDFVVFVGVDTMEAPRVWRSDRESHGCDCVAGGAVL